MQLPQVTTSKKVRLESFPPNQRQLFYVSYKNEATSLSKSRLIPQHPTPFGGMAEALGRGDNMPHGHYSLLDSEES